MSQQQQQQQQKQQQQQQQQQRQKPSPSGLFIHLLESQKVRKFRRINAGWALETGRLPSNVGVSEHITLRDQADDHEGYPSKPEKHKVDLASGAGFVDGP